MSMKLSRLLLTAILVSATSVAWAKKPKAQAYCPGYSMTAKVVTGNSYTITQNDFCKWVVFTSSGTINVTLPSIGLAQGFNSGVLPLAGSVTMMPVAGGPNAFLATINGASSDILSGNQGAEIRVGIDGNWYALPGAAAGAGTGTVTAITFGTGLTGGTITTSGTAALANTTVTAGSYTNTNLTVDAQGRITAAANGSGGGGTPGGSLGQIQFNNSGAFGGFTMSGDATTNTGTGALTLATVNGTVGTYASVTINGKGLATSGANLTGDVTTVNSAATLANTAVTAGSYTNTNLTVDAKGRITAAANGSGGASGISGLTTGQLGIAGSATTISSSVPFGTTGANTVVETNGSGQIVAGVMPALTGDVTSSAGSVATTLANTAVSAGSYTNTNLTVDAKGRITAASNGSGGGGTTDTVNTGLSAAGTNQATCTVLTGTNTVYGIWYYVSTVASGTGVCLPAAAAGIHRYVVNEDARDLLIYAAAGGSIINALGATTGVTLAPNNAAHFGGKSTTAWRSVP